MIRRNQTGFDKIGEKIPRLRRKPQPWQNGQYTIFTILLMNLKSFSGTILNIIRRIKEIARRTIFCNIEHA